MDENNKLPDDLSQWPDNNWELFGLDSQSASYNDLRKAYSKLIKLFRPETRPEHFQRIQSAFETLRDLIQSKNNPNQEEEQDSNSEIDEAVQKRRSQRQTQFINTLYCQYINKADWDGAKKYLESVIDLEEPIKEKPEEIADLGEIPYLYMFWLLYAINPPEEDNFPDIIKYLIMGEKVRLDEDMSLSMKTLVFFLERKELPYTDGVYDYCMTHLDFPAILLLVNVRWLNLCFEDDVDVVEIVLKDLETLKKRFKSQDLRAWARINIEAVERLLWINSDAARTALNNCMNEVTQYPDYRRFYDDKLDNLDRLEEAIESLRKLSPVLPVDINIVRTVILMAGNSIFTRYRRLVLRLAAELADDVLRAFMVFDYLNQYHPLVAPRLFMPLQQLYLSRHQEDEKELTKEQIDKVVEKVLQILDAHHGDYNSCRLPFLKYFLQEQLDPSDVLEYMSNYYEKIKDDPSHEKEAETINKWHSEYVNDGSIVLTYYTVMSCEMEDMENIEEDED